MICFSRGGDAEGGAVFRLRGVILFFIFFGVGNGVIGGGEGQARTHLETCFIPSGKIFAYLVGGV